MHKWRFFKSARCVQVKLENGEDLAALKDLDQKLWTVLAASTEGLRFDADTLKLLDTDGDGRIRVPEVLSAVDWMRGRFKNLDFLFAGKDAGASPCPCAPLRHGFLLCGPAVGAFSRQNVALADLSARQRLILGPNRAGSGPFVLLWD